jgi:hypothetical protein
MLAWKPEFESGQRKYIPVQIPFTVDYQYCTYEYEKKNTSWK